jgi:hypothetical protein
VRASILPAWRAYVRRWEGVTLWMYLDTKGKVTTGIGFLIDSITAAQALPWVVQATGHSASPSEIAQEWRRVKAMQSKKHLNGLNAVWRNSSRLRISQATVDRQLDKMTPQYWDGVKQTLPELDTFPADAGLAVLDEAWQNGKAFLELKDSKGVYVWAGTRAALLSRNFGSAASHVPGSGDRADFRKRLLSNAAIVERNGMDPDTLWDTKVPTPQPPEGFDMAAAKDVYKRAKTDQSVKAALDTFVAIDDKTPSRGVSVCVGENPGVHVGMVLTFNSATPVDVALWPVLSDVGPNDTKDRARRLGGWHQFQAGNNLELTAEYRGKIPAPSAKGRSNRLRFRIRASAPITIVNSEVTGWEMP